MQSGTAILTSRNNVRSGMANNAEPKPEKPWIIPAARKISDINSNEIIFPKTGLNDYSRKVCMGDSGRIVFVKPL